MISMIRILQRNKHPLTWFYSTLFYINLFVGMWLHNWLLITTSLIGVLTVTLFHPPMKNVPAWAEKFIATISEQWQETPFVVRYSLLFTSLAVTVLLLYALWQNSVLLTVLSLVAIILIKGYFLRKPLGRFYNRSTNNGAEAKEK